MENTKEILYQQLKLLAEASKELKNYPSELAVISIAMVKIAVQISNL